MDVHVSEFSGMKECEFCVSTARELLESAGYTVYHRRRNLERICVERWLYEFMKLSPVPSDLFEFRALMLKFICVRDFPVCNVVPAGCREFVYKVEESIRRWAVRGGGPSGSTSDDALNKCIERSEVMPEMVALLWHCDIRP